MRLFNTYRDQSGFTLIELLIVLVIAGILATMAGPSFTDFVNRTRQNSVVSQLYSDLNRARSEAIKRNVRVLVCERASDTACGTDVDWKSGWLVCVDSDKDDACDASTSSIPNPVVIHSPLHTSLTLTGSVALIRFYPSGISGNGAATLSVGGTWSGATTNTINVAATGNISRP